MNPIAIRLLSQQLICPQFDTLSLIHISSDEMFEDYAFSKLRSRYYAWNGLSFAKKLYRSFGLVDNQGILTYAGLLMADECPLRQSRVSVSYTHLLLCYVSTL